MTNDITILSCPQCGFPRIRDVGNGLYQCDDCGTHFDKDENVVLTNEEWIKSLDTEGLVDYLYEVHKGGNSVERQMWIERHKEQVKMQFRGWLKEKHE